MVAAHCVKLDRDDLEVIARTGTQVSYNPVSNMYLGNGFAPVLDMFELGIDVSLASDGGACGNTEDMLEVLKYGVLQPKAVAQDPRVFNARDVLRVATAGGAKALGLGADLGALDVGRLADMFLFDPYRLKTVPMHDPISTLVYAGSQSNVHTVIVDGNVVLDAGRFPNIDEDAFVREVQERALALAERVGTFRLMRGRRFTPVPLRPRRHGQGRRHRGTSGGGRRSRSASHQRRRLRRPAQRASGHRAPAARLRRPGQAREGGVRRMLLDNCTVVTMDAERRILRDAAIVVQGNSIAAVGKSSEIRPRFPEEPVRDLHGWVVTPGLVDGHIHLPQAILRGCGDEVPLWVWMAERIFILEGAFTAEDARISMRLAALEMLKAGTTAFLETLILGRHALDDLAEAVEATGMRAVLPRGITDGGGYLDESPLSKGLYEAPERGDRGRARGRQAVPRLRADPDLVRAALDGRHLRGAAARARRRSPARRAWACASTTP